MMTRLNPQQAKKEEFMELMKPPNLFLNSRNNLTLGLARGGILGGKETTTSPFQTYNQVANKSQSSAPNSGALVSPSIKKPETQIVKKSDSTANQRIKQVDSSLQTKNTETSKGVEKKSEYEDLFKGAEIFKGFTELGLSHIQKMEALDVEREKMAVEQKKSELDHTFKMEEVASKERMHGKDHQVATMKCQYDYQAAIYTQDKIFEAKNNELEYKTRELNVLDMQFYKNLDLENEKRLDARAVNEQNFISQREERENKKIMARESNEKEIHLANLGIQKMREENLNNIELKRLDVGAQSYWKREENLKEMGSMITSQSNANSQLLSNFGNQISQIPPEYRTFYSNMVHQQISSGDAIKDCYINQMASRHNSGLHGYEKPF